MANKNFALSLNDEVIIAGREPLTEYRKKILIMLYRPIIGNHATTLYSSLYDFIENGKIESKVFTHQNLLNNLQIADLETFLSNRQKLEALGLLETYLKEDSVNKKIFYVYLLKEVSDPYDFLTNPILEELLRASLGNTSFDEVVAELLVHRYDLTSFKNITKSLDDIYEVEKASTHSKYQNYWISSKNSGVSLKKNHFDYECLLIMVEALDLLDYQILRSLDFYDTVNRLSFMYGLTVEEMTEAIKNAVTPSRTIDYEILKISVKYQYDQKNQVVKLKPITVKTTTNDKTIRVLENNSPSEIVASRYGTSLTSSEVEIFEKLQTATGLPLGVINTLIIYVVDSKAGEIPSYNYFLKIANTWIRGGVKTTKDALDRITGNSPTTSKGSSKKEKSTASWYDEYVENEKQKLANQKNETADTLEDLEEFFKKK